MTKIEEVARAIFARRNCWFGAPTWETTSDDVRASFLADARAAIKAMREPSAAMLEAVPPIRDEAGHVYLVDLVSVHTAMIDAALNEGKE